MVSYVASYIPMYKSQESKPKEDKGLSIGEISPVTIPLTLLDTKKDEQLVVAASGSLAGRTQLIQPKSILKILVEQVKQTPEHASELINALKAAASEHTESEKEFQEAIQLLTVDKQTAEKRINAIEKEWLEECVMVKDTLASQKYESTWLSYAVATGGAIWYVTKVSGTVLYFVCDKVILNGKVLKLAAAAGGIVSVINIVGNPCLPVLQTVVFFLFRKLIY